MSLILGSDKKGSIFDDRRKGERRKNAEGVTDERRKVERRKENQKIKNK